jgi:hypothetical protein
VIALVLDLLIAVFMFARGVHLIRPKSDSSAASTIVSM